MNSLLLRLGFRRPQRMTAKGFAVILVALAASSVAGVVLFAVALVSDEPLSAAMPFLVPVVLAAVVLSSFRGRTPHNGTAEG